jgi:diadenylate cyclase
MSTGSRRSAPAHIPGESRETRELVRASFELARTLGIGKLLVQAAGPRVVQAVESHRERERIVWLSRGDLELEVPPSARRGHVVLTIPEGSRLTRMSQISVALFLAVLDGHIEVVENVLCLSGPAGSGRLDTLWIANPRRDLAWFARQDVGTLRERVPTRELARVLDIALRLAVEGREGKPIGTIFVIGEPEELEPHLRQLVLNPCVGHPRKARSIYNPEYIETLREYAAMDGAFIVSRKGVVEAAATYLAAPGGRATLRSGLGARHAAAAAMTATTESVAIVLSESSGHITAYHEGSPILELERPLQRWD